MPKKNKWFIAYKERGEDLFDLEGLKIIEPPKDRYHADPFLFKGLLFFEDYDYEKGVISVRTFDSEPEVVLERPYHLSFPFLMQDGSDIYMLPETGRNGQLELYAAKNFPYDWQLVHIIKAGVFGDSVIWKQHDRSYQLFTTEGDNDLRIFRTDNLLGKWELAYSDSIMHSRAAGNPFMHEGKFIRPVQDCTKDYGGATVFKETTLGPLREKIIGRIEPDWFPGLTGTHTFNFDQNHVVIDGRVKL